MQIMYLTKDSHLLKYIKNSQNERISKQFENGQKVILLKG